MDQDRFALSHYAGNKLVLGGPRRFNMIEITDGSSRTALAGEAAGNFGPWAKPTQGRDFQLGLDTSLDGFGGSRQNHTTLVLMVDGRVIEVHDDIDGGVLSAIATPNGRENIPLPND